MNLDDIKNLPALSIRQPWAWLVVRSDLSDPAERRRQCKNVENREWSTPFRGRVLIHAGKTKPSEELMTDVEQFARLGLPGVRPPLPVEMEFGGIIGSARIVDCVTSHRSPWFIGPFGFLLEDIRPLPFVPCRGMLGFFVPKFDDAQHEIKVPRDSSVINAELIKLPPAVRAEKLALATAIMIDKLGILES